VVFAIVAEIPPRKKFMRKFSFGTEAIEARLPSTTLEANGSVDDGGGFII